MDSSWGCILQTEQSNQQIDIWNENSKLKEHMSDIVGYIHLRKKQNIKEISVLHRQSCTGVSTIQETDSRALHVD